MDNEVRIVNGSVVGVHLGAPMQDATPDYPEDNEQYATEKNTVTRVGNSEEVWEEQPKAGSGSGSNVTIIVAETDVESNLPLLIKPTYIEGTSTPVTCDQFLTAFLTGEVILHWCSTYYAKVISVVKTSDTELNVNYSFFGVIRNVRFTEPTV